jgi:hypothetical protein
MLATLCPDAIGHIAGFLSTCEQRVGDGVCFERELSRVRVAVHPLHQLAHVCTTLRAIVNTASPLKDCVLSAWRAFVRVRESHDAALVLDPSGMRRMGCKAERIALLERMLSAIGAHGGLPVRLSVSSAGEGDLRYDRGYIAEMHGTSDTEVTCGDCSMVEANWVRITIRCPATGKEIQVPRRFECGTLRIENLYSRDHGRISVSLESFEQEELLFSMLLLRSKNEAEAWGFDWARWGGGLGARLSVAIGPASKRSDCDFGELMMSQRSSPMFVLSSSP